MRLATEEEVSKLSTINPSPRLQVLIDAPGKWHHIPEAETPPRYIELTPLTEDEARLIGEAAFFGHRVLTQVIPGPGGFFAALIQ